MTNTVLFIAWLLCSIQLALAVTSMLKTAPKKSLRPLAAAHLAILIVLIFANTIRLGVIALVSLHDVFLIFSLTCSLLVAASKREPYAVLILSFGAWLGISLALSPLAPPPGSPEPVLSTTWLILHVLVSTAGEALIYAGALLLISWLISKKEKSFLLADNLIYAGYLFFTAGALLFGAVWAFFAWGSFWSWDPKETWSLITWLGFTAYVHLGSSHKKEKWALAILYLSVAFMLFTLLGVPYLFDGKHSYG